MSQTRGKLQGDANELLNKTYKLQQKKIDVIDKNSKKTSAHNKKMWRLAWVIVVLGIITLCITIIKWWSS